MAKPTLTHVRFCEPFSADGSGHCEVYLTKDEAIAIQQKLADERKFTYRSPEDALQDFMTVNWAEFVSAPAERDAYMKRMEETINTLSADLAGFAVTHGWVQTILLKAHYIMYPENKPKDFNENNKTNA